MPDKMKQPGKDFLLLPGYSHILGLVIVFFSPLFNGKNMEKNHTEGRKFEREEGLVGVK